MLVLASPLALPVLDDVGDRDWRRLSEIGQTYGAVSAVLSALALGGVAGSLALQRQPAELDRRSAKLDRELAFRSVHTELLMFGIQNPDLLEMFGRWARAESPNERPGIDQLGAAAFAGALGRASSPSRASIRAPTSRDAQAMNSRVSS